MAVFGFTAFIFDSIGPGEWIVFLAVVLIIVGPSRLPSTARKIGRMLTVLRRTADNFKDQLMSMDGDSPSNRPEDDSVGDDTRPVNSEEFQDENPRHSS